MQTIQQFSTWFSKQKRVGKLAIGCGGLFVFFCLCSFSIAVLSPSPSNTEAASTSVDVSSIQTSAFDTAVAGIYQTAAANTITPLPTMTSSPSIPTFTPSAIPTVTPQATLTPEEDLYILAMSEKVPAYVDAYFMVVQNHQEVADDVSLLFDTSWKTKQGLALGLLNLQANEMAAVQPSPKYQTLHSIITELAAETNLFSSAYASGVDNLDANLIDQATQHMQNMTTLMDQATAELKRIAPNP